MKFNLNKDEETVRFYKKENKQLKEKIEEYEKELDELSTFRTQYLELIEQIKDQKRHYEKLNDKYETIISDCKKQLESLYK